MWRTGEGSTGRLLQLCLGYFVFYTIFGVAVKYFGRSGDGFPGMHGVEFLLYSTIGGSIVAFLVVLVRRWYRLESRQQVRWGKLRFPAECLYIVPSGVCTAVVIPTTTLMYSLPISVMVAMVIMRGSIIVVSRLVDSVQIRQGLLHKRVFFEENVAVVFALLAMGAQLLWVPSIVNPVVDWLARAGLEGAARVRLAAGAAAHFEFLRSGAAVTILGTYIVAYAVRIYIMNYYKNTRAPGQRLNNKAFFAIEQIAAFLTLVLVTVILVVPPAGPGQAPEPVRVLRGAFHSPHPQWSGAVFAGMSFGIVAFFSVFIFMFQGRTATFAGLVNRLTSLIAGTASTLGFHFAFGGRFPEPADWLALVFILVAVAFLTQAERRRQSELVKEREFLPAAPRERGARAAAPTG